jgi:hypothetical protein
MNGLMFRLALAGLLAWDAIPSPAQTQNVSPQKSSGANAPAAVSRYPGGMGHRFTLSNGMARVPVVVVRGTPDQMGWHLGRLMRDEIQRCVPPVVAGFKQKLQFTDEMLDQAWATTAGYTDARVLREIAALADGSGVPVRLLQHAHCLPLLMPYSCSSIAAWGDATEDGHLYQTRNLDWSLEAGAHEFPVLVVYLPDRGHAHVSLSMARPAAAHPGRREIHPALLRRRSRRRRRLETRVGCPLWRAGPDAVVHLGNRGFGAERR